MREIKKQMMVWDLGRVVGSAEKMIKELLNVMLEEGKELLLLTQE